MNKKIQWIFYSLILILIPQFLYAASPYASVSGAGVFHVTDQTVDVWGDADGNGKPDIIDTKHNENVDVIQGPDQDWSGPAGIQPGYINYDSFLGEPDKTTSGWGGAASGGILIVGFEQNFLDGDKDLLFTDYGKEEIIKKGADFIVAGFGFSFNKAFSDERGTVNIYIADESFNPVINEADPITGLRSITGDETKWVKLSEWQGRQNDGTWIGNPDHNYASGVGAYCNYLWGDIKGSGLSSARYIKIELGDGGYYIDPYTGEQNNGRALFVDAVKTLYHCPVAVPGNDRQVKVDQEITLDGSDSCDLDYDPLTFTWTQAGGNPQQIIFSDPNSEQPKITLPQTGTYLFTLKVDDGSFQHEENIIITVVPANVNLTPYARAGDDRSWNVGENIILDGSNSFDPNDNDVLSFSWVQISGPDIKLNNSNSSKASFICPYTPLSPVFKLIVTDSGGLIDTDTIAININRPPIVDLSRTKETATENLLFTLDASKTWDPDIDNELTYNWTQLSGPAVQMLDPNIECPTFIVPENPNETMEFKIVVSDGHGFFIEDKISIIIRKLYIIKEDNPATSALRQVGAFSFRKKEEGLGPQQSLDKGAAALEVPDFTFTGDGDVSGFPDDYKGSLTLKFNIPIADGEGCDLSIYHFGTGDTEVFASMDDEHWVSLGKLDSVSRNEGVVEKQDFDLADFPNLSPSKVISMQYIKIVKSDTDAEHYIDGLIGHYTALTGIWATYAQEAQGMVDWVDKKSDSGFNALGKPDYDDSTPGIGNCSGWMVNGGFLTLGFDNPFTDRGGPDLIIYHFGQGVTDKDISLGNTKGATTVEVSEDGTNWIPLGDLPLGKNYGNDLSIDSFDFHNYPALGDLDDQGFRKTKIQYVRINKNGTGYTSGKFFDSIEGRYGFPGMGDPAGADITVLEGSRVTLGRQNPARDDYRENTYVWEQIDNGAPKAFLSANDVKNPTFIAPMIDQNSATFIFQLTRYNYDRFGISRSIVHIKVIGNGITGFDKNIFSFLNPVAIQNMGFSTQNCRLVFYKIGDPDYKFSADKITDMKGRPKNLDYGMIDFHVTTDAPNQTAIINVHLSEPAPKDCKWFKYSKKTGWIEFMRGSVSASSTDGAVFSSDRKTISIHITDNGPFDDDDREKIIHDPSGLGITGGWHSSGGGGSGGGSGGGCFINNLFN